MNIFTIGFTKTSAESFFACLQRAGVRSVVDVRLNNVSQLAGFAKKKDLGYFLKAFLDNLSSMPASLFATFAPIWRTFDALATSDQA